MRNYLCFGMLLLLCTTCEPFFEQKRENIIRTGKPLEIRTNAAFIEGLLLDVSDLEDKNIQAYGHVWSTSPNPTVSGPFTNFINSTQPLTFVSFLSNLERETPYFVRAYLTTSEGTSYGEEITVIPGLVSTISVTNIGLSTAIGVGEFSELAQNAQEFGHCWATHNLPTLEDNQAEGQNPSEGNTYFTNLNNLESGRSYFVRAYVIDSNGFVSYGEVIFFETNI